MDRRKYTDDNFKNVLEGYGYTYISGKYINTLSKFKCYDKDGYIVYPCFDKIENDKKLPRRFHKSNPDVIYNIKHYLNIHPECECIYVSGEYINSRSILVFKCKCGNLFKTTFDSVRQRKKTKCDECTGYSKNLTFEQIKNNLKEKGFYLIVDKNDFKGITLSPLTCIDDEGYLYDVVYDQVLNDHFPFPIAKSNKYSIQNINTFLRKNTNGQYICLSTEYNGKKDKLKLKHLKCGREFQNSWGNISRKRCLDSISDNKTGAKCPHCECSQLESTHALVLKQVWLHEHPDTIVEDRSCINPNTNCSLPTDIVNHRLKIAIEIQSWFHDSQSQKKKDKIKETFWKSIGYNFYAIDHRDYSILEMIQVFFPDICEIPNYIDLSYSNKIDETKIQELLNKGYSVKECAELLNYKSHTIYDAIGAGKITYPEDYHRMDHSPVIQYDLENNFIAEYTTIEEAISTTGIKYISSALCNGRHYSGGYNWYYKYK